MKAISQEILMLYYPSKRNFIIKKKKLYSRDEHVRFDLVNQTGVTLSQDEKSSIELPLTIEELKQSLDQLANGKTADCDGFTVKFYKKFWENIKFTLQKP